MNIPIEVAQQLVKEQFPEWKDLLISPVLKNGNDNKTFHLGETMTLRLPSDKRYVAQVEKEAKWLPFLAENLDLPITCPKALGKPNKDYPYFWSINSYIEGETADSANISNLDAFANDLAVFLKQLQCINQENAPISGEHNFYRGSSPVVYNEEVRKALENLADELPVKLIEKIWSESIESEWQEEPVWIHGDIAPGNLLVKENKLSGVIDFGIMGIGDPSCDYAMAWTFFDESSRKIFLQDLDQNTINRSRGWALWKALITYDKQESKEVVKTIIDERV
ncbi:aminoglycoside phosphotransferase family protein [Vagococcus carniphilus]|uniref:aminoglycoside phosphotransferase family protein n=1 Tax=Vagococcus carniphilus TaxID=218144 RepID=UPI003B5BAF53